MTREKSQNLTNFVSLEKNKTKNGQSYHPENVNPQSSSCRCLKFSRKYRHSSRQNHFIDVKEIFSSGNTGISWLIRLGLIELSKLWPKKNVPRSKIKSQLFDLVQIHLPPLITPNSQPSGLNLTS